MTETDLRRFLADPAATPATIATALALAFFLGAAHALQPGHGKALVAAYLVGSRGRLFDAIYLGAVVTATHTASVFALGIATLYAAQQFSPEAVTRWLALVSGLLVAAIGLWLLVRRSRGVEHDPDHPEDSAGVHYHAQPGGLPGLSHSHAHSLGDGGSGSLLSLGISGGLVPCPEALIVLLFAVSIHRIAFGLALIASFSLGLAAVLIAIGIAMVYAGPAMRSAAGCADSAWLRRLPVVSALVVTLVGIVMVVQAALAF